MFNNTHFHTKLEKWWRKYVYGKSNPKSPRELLGAVFDVVQLSNTFADSKTFVDMIPSKRPKLIIKNYFKKYRAQLDILRFVRDNFLEPSAVPEIGVKNSHSPAPLKVREYIDIMWSALRRDTMKPSKHSSLLALPKDYIVPGGRFRELFYWDSYFIMLGLRENGQFDLMEDILQNFAFLIDKYGFIPNANRSYFMTRSQPPHFSLMVTLLAEIKGEHIYNKYLPYIQMEYDYWMRGVAKSEFSTNKINQIRHAVRMQDGEVLNRYWDKSISPREESFREDREIGKRHDEPAGFYRCIRAGAESGWDFSSRWLENPEEGRASIRTTDIVPVDLNVLLYMSESILCTIYDKAGKHKLSRKYKKLAENRHNAILKYFWDEEQGWFCDYVFSKQERNKAINMAGVYPLVYGLATDEQAGRVIKNIEDKFLKTGGVVTTLITTEEQWDAPNGWAPLNYLAVLAVEKYGADELAKEISARWCALNISIFEKTGRLFEKYNVEDIDAYATGGEYELQHGFGWTNGVLLTLMNKYQINKEIPGEIEMPVIEEMREPEHRVNII